MSNMFATQFVTSNANSASVEVASRVALEKIVDEGVSRTSATIEKVLTEVPTDIITNAKAIRVGVLGGGYDPNGRPLPGGKFLSAWGIENSKLDISQVTDNAMGQLCGRLELPAPYLRSMVEGEPWQQALSTRVMNEHLDHANQRLLVRSYGPTHRAFLSDRYRRLDSRPLLESFVTACQGVGAVPVEGLASDTKCSIRAILPRVVEPVPGEYMVLGLNWSNSDYGAGTYAVSFFAMRLLCQNGMLGESAIKQVHLGGRLPEDLQFSQRTYDQDTRTSASATTDIVRSLLSPAAVDKRLALIRDAASQETTFAAAYRSLRNQLNKGETKALKESFESSESILLPAGQTKWRFSNALSWIANQTESADRRGELQALAGRVVL